MKITASQVGIILVILLVLCGCCIVVSSMGELLLFRPVNPGNAPKPLSQWRPLPPTPTMVVERPSTHVVELDSYATLQGIDVPESDRYDLACRLQGICDIPATLLAPVFPRGVGETDSFWTINVDTHKLKQVTAILRYVSEHLYFWVEDGIYYDDGDLQALADYFESHIYPATRAFFGSEWIPGVDGGPHIYILYARGLGFSLAGYFSSTDELHPLVHEYSNGHEMFLFNADTTSLDEDFTYGVLAHEFQHMIQWLLDRNETSWLNEGLSELAVFINGYEVGSFDRSYVSNPDLQLNDWPNDHPATAPHYGSGFLFTNYFLGRFGETATQALVADSRNGLDSVDGVLDSLHIMDAMTGASITTEDLFLDWVLANYLQDPGLADGRYAYALYPAAPRAGATETISSCLAAGLPRSVHQYGVDYIQVTCPGDYVLSFSGATTTNLLPVDAYSGSYAFWSNKGDESDMTLTRSFDFTGISAPITLAYQAWYDIEEDYDYVYLAASTDGHRWQVLNTPSGTPEDPTGTSFGWGYNGFSGGWIREEVDLSQYAGQQVWLRFEYVTDAAINGEGFLLDDVTVPAVDYFTDFEADDGGWLAAGFARVTNTLPQIFRLALLTRGSDGVTVEKLPISSDQAADITIHIGDDVQEVVLVVTGTSRFTRQLANYEINIH